MLRTSTTCAGARSTHPERLRDAPRHLEAPLGAPLGVELVDYGGGRAVAVGAACSQEHERSSVVHDLAPAGSRPGGAASPLQT